MEVLMGKSSINGPFSMAMLNNQRVYIYIYVYTYWQPIGPISSIQKTTEDHGK